MTISDRADAGPIAPVDLSAWFDGDESARRTIAASVDEACAGSGFLAITGHGIDPRLIADMREVTSAFFDLPVAQKLAYRLDDLEGNRGYASLGSEALSYSLGVESVPDLFEAFNIGRDTPPPGESEETIGRYFASNVWPSELPEMRDIWLRYWDACESLGLVLVDVFALALGLPDGWFRPFVDRSISVMRANNYERAADAAPLLDGQLRMGAHSDYGSLTILLADRVPGLQIRDVDGRWHDVLPPDGSLLVNLGDLLAEWTNDRWRSTMHRVVPPPDDTEGPFRRRSIAWFQQPNHDAVIEVLASCCGPERPPRYPPTTSGEHMMAKLMGPRAAQEVEVAEGFLDS